MGKSEPWADSPGLEDETDARGKGTRPGFEKSNSENDNTTNPHRYTFVTFLLSMMFLSIFTEYNANRQKNANLNHRTV
jgi:hypothetical protein